MTSITPTLLNDTLSLIQLARETARNQGKEAQVERLSPLVDGLRNAVSEARDVKSSATMLNQDGFKTLLNAVDAPAPKSPSASASGMVSSPAERSQMVWMMAEGGMKDIDIARHLGITRDDVQLVLSLQHGSSRKKEGFS
jgi:hypothetical protein